MMRPTPNEGSITDGVNFLPGAKQQAAACV